MRIVIADDSVLLREGLARLLTEAHHEPVACVGDGDALLDAIAEHQPDLALVDIRMPATFTHEGAIAATVARARWPDLGILLLSQTIESRYALDLARSHPKRFGYLLKDHILDVALLTDAIATVAAAARSWTPTSSPSSSDAGAHAIASKPSPRASRTSSGPWPKDDRTVPSPPASHSTRRPSKPTSAAS